MISPLVSRPHFRFASILTAAALLTGGRLPAQEYGWQPFVGQPTGATYVDSVGREARFLNPRNIVVDAAGNALVIDANNRMIRKVTPEGVVTSYAGKFGVSGIEDGPLSEVAFSYLRGLVFDPAGSLYLSDGSKVRKVTTDGEVIHVAGSYVGTQGHADATGGAARFNIPEELAVDLSGNVFVIDNNNIRRITPFGVVTTFAGPGSSGNTGMVNGSGTNVRFTNPTGIVAAPDGNLYVADDGNHAIRKITPSGVVTILAGSSARESGHVDGTGSAARFNGISSLALDRDGNLVVTSNQTVRRITMAGVVTTVAGSPGVAGDKDGSAGEARFSDLQGIAVGISGEILVTELENLTVRRIAPSGVVTTLAGFTAKSGNRDGTGPDARFLSPNGMALDLSGNLWVTDTSNHTIRKVTPAGVVTTVAGVAGIEGDYNGTGNEAGFRYPSHITRDLSGNFLISDNGNQQIRKMTPAGVVTTLAGAPGASGTADGTATAARFYSPRGSAMDLQGNLIVADSANHAIRRVTPNRVVTTISGVKGTSGSNVSYSSSTYYSAPRAVAVTQDGSIYVVDRNNYCVRRVLASGEAPTIAGDSSSSSRVDGPGNVARFLSPMAIAADTDGNLLVADGPVLRKITLSPSVTVSTVAGTTSSAAGDSGTGSSVYFGNINGITMGSPGTVYLSTDRLTIFKGTAPFRKIAVEQPVSNGLVSGGAGVDFGTVSPGQSVSKTFLIRNSGTQVITLSGVTLSGTDAAQFTLGTANVPSTLAAGGSAIFSVTFTPSGSGSRSAQVQVGSDDGATPSFAIALTGTGAGTTPVDPQAAWRDEHFGSPDNTGNAADDADPDGDGWCNVDEFVSGTCPTDSGSTLRITAMVASGNDHTVTFPTVLGRLYAVEWTDTLSGDSWQPVLTNGTPASGIPGTGEAVQVTDTGGAGQLKRFYRISVTR
ncbi:MAG: choice-of-anchor D domain-containing protein [Verrucomicrobiaceae bacterium]|nr:MAG: choice-of-anchor D domain-containing protein [Verrucomicrobiaceae bacterium]